MHAWHVCDRAVTHHIAWCVSLQDSREVFALQLGCRVQSDHWAGHKNIHSALRHTMLCCSLPPCVVLYMIMPACSAHVCVCVWWMTLYLFPIGTSRGFFIGWGFCNCRAARLWAMCGGPWCSTLVCVYAGVYHVTVTSSPHTAPAGGGTVSPSRTV